MEFTMTTRTMSKWSIAIDMLCILCIVALLPMLYIAIHSPIPAQKNVMLWLAIADIPLAFVSAIRILTKDRNKLRRTYYNIYTQNRQKYLSLIWICIFIFGFFLSYILKHL